MRATTGARRATPGLRHLAFVVDNIDAAVADLRGHSGELVGEVVRYEDMFRRGSSSSWQSGSADGSSRRVRCREPGPSSMLATVAPMSEASNESIAQLEAQLDGAVRALSSVGSLNARQAERVAERMDRLASQLMAVTPPPPMEAVHERLGTTPASRDEFASVVDEMGSPDGEG